MSIDFACSGIDATTNVDKVHVSPNRRGVPCKHGVDADESPQSEAHDDSARLVWRRLYSLEGWAIFHPRRSSAFREVACVWGVCSGALASIKSRMAGPKSRAGAVRNFCREVCSDDVLCCHLRVSHPISRCLGPSVRSPSARAETAHDPADFPGPGGCLGPPSIDSA